MRKKLIEKIFDLFASLLLVGQILTPALPLLASPSYIYAQEEQAAQEQSTSSEPAVSPVADPEPTPSASEQPQVSPSPEPSIVPSESPSSSPSIDQNDQSNSEDTGNGSNDNKAPPSESPAPSSTPDVTVNNEVGSGEIRAEIVRTSQEAENLGLDLPALESEASAQITTDKPDYTPTEIVVITGSKFEPDTTYILVISSSDEPPVDFSTDIKTDENGGFLYAYQLDGNYRPNYKVELRDSTGTIVATTTFTDAAKTASVSGNWSNTATWGGSAVPTSADDVTINPGITVTVTADAAANSIIFANSGTATGILTVDTSVSLTVTNGITLRNAAGANTSATLAGAGTINAASVTVGGTTTPTGGTDTTTLNSTISTLSLSGNLSLTGLDSGANDNNVVFNLQSGSVSVGGSVVLNKPVGSTVSFTLANGAQTGTLTLSGATPFTVTGSPTFTANGTSATVVYSGGAQTAKVTTYNNLTLSGSDAKTFATTPTVNGILSMEGTAIVTVTTGVVTYGTNATLQYNTSTARTATAEEWKTPFAATGGVIIANTGTITLNAAKVFNASVPLTINSGATLATGNFQLTFGGNFVNNGTLIGGSAPIVIANTMVTQSIAGFTTTGLVSKTKASGTATLMGNVNGGGLTISGNGTLNLGSGLTHTFTGAWTRTAGTLNGGSSTLNIAGTVTNTAGTFTASTSTVNYNGAAQTIANVTYNKLTLSGSGAKSITRANGSTLANGDVSIAPTGSATINITGTNLGVNSLTLGGINKTSGTWGSTSSAATHKDNTYFAATTGYLNVATTTDSTAPILSPVHIQSDNSNNTSLVKVGDVVTVSFTASESVTGTSVTIAGNAASLSGSGTGPYSATYTMVSGDSEGTVAFSISGFKDAADNTGTTVSATTDASSVTFDKTAPGAPGTPSTTSPTNSPTQTWTWTAAVEAVSGIQTYFYRITGSLVQPLTSTSSNVASFITSLGQGIYNFFVTAQDNAGNTGSESSGGSLTVDSTAPVGNISINLGATYTKNNDVSLTFFGVSADVTTMELGDGPTGSYQDSIAFETPHAYTLPSNGDGNYAIRVRFKDTAGNVSDGTILDSIVLDKTNPTDPTPSSASHTASTWNSDTTVDVTWTGASDGIGSGVDGFYTEWNNSATTMTGLVVKEYEETADAETSPSLSTGQDHYFHIATVDNAGNWTSTAHLGPFWIDADDPVISLNSPANGSLLRVTVSLQASASDTGSGLNPVEFSYRKSADVSFTSLGIDATDPYSFNWDTTSADDGDYVLRAAVSDGSGRISWSDVNVTVDNTAPTITVDTLTTSDPTPGFSGTINDDDATISLTVNGNTYIDAYTNGDGTWSLDQGTIDPLPDGTYDVSVSATDTAGNVGNDATTDELIVDATDPTNPGTPTTTTPTNDNTPTWNWTASADTNLDHYIFFWDIIVGGETNNSGNISDNFFTHLVALADGTWYGKVKAYDAANNSSAFSGNGSVLIDTVAPDEPVAAPAAGDYTSDQSVTLSSSGSDAIYYTTDGTTPSDTNGTLYSNPIAITADTTLKAIAYDNAGNTSTVLSAIYGIASQISGENTVNVGSAEVTFVWTTDILATSRVVYDTVSHADLGEAPNYGYANSTGEYDTNPKVLSHTVVVCCFDQSTTYFYRVISQGSPEAASAEQTFTTMATPPQSINPNSQGPGITTPGPAGPGPSAPTTTAGAVAGAFTQLGQVLGVGTGGEVLGEATAEATPTASPSPSPTVGEPEEAEEAKAAWQNWWWLILLILLGAGTIWWFTKKSKEQK